ncbi:MAG: DUF3899 domain-containing protein [Clostridia bacterium]|nr:DUF3899 domain-containing protein [Clostridia bacterium]
MNEKLKRALISYGVSFVIGFLFVIVVLWLRDFSFNLELSRRYLILADAFTIPGVAIFGIGCLVLISYSGVFDGIAYALSHTVKMLIPGAERTDRTFYDYKTRMADKRKERSKFLFLPVVGLFFLAVAVVFTILFLNIE